MPTVRQPQAPALPVIERGVRLALKRDDYLYGPSYKHVLNVEVVTVGADLAQYPVMEWLWLTVTVNGSASDATRSRSASGSRLFLTPSETASRSSKRYARHAGLGSACPQTSDHRGAMKTPARRDSAVHPPCTTLRKGAKRKAPASPAGAFRVSVRCSRRPGHQLKPTTLCSLSSMPYRR